MSAFPVRHTSVPRATDPEPIGTGYRIAFDRPPGSDLDWLPPDAFGRLYPGLEQAIAVARQIDALGDGIGGDTVRVIHADSGRILWHSIPLDALAGDPPVEDAHV
ncbi:hypothetical protein CCR95_17220 [Thiocystis minor]|jgi:hypothetical protein|uniref:hypothetical protein n=1 Tax=Thiocystis minor TaxID=61597 RepID=UPI0019113135|nr:hypothetical protein [Thiocystis minor]MBK5965771.1 hypothetical protein [Thiocystis minor]